MKTLEQDPRLPAWLNKLLNSWPFCIDTDSVKTLAVAYDAEGLYEPGRRSLFYNGYVMVRVCWPYGFWVHIKPRADRRLQFGEGFKLNGRFGVTFRWQSDESAARGVLGPNYGQASAWARGTA